jgi:hypothetical protein
MKKAYIVSNNTPERLLSRLRPKLEELGFTVSGLGTPERAATMQLGTYDVVLVLYDRMGHKQFEAVEKRCGKCGVRCVKITRKKCSPEWAALAEFVGEESDDVPSEWVPRHKLDSFLRAVRHEVMAGKSWAGVLSKVGQFFEDSLAATPTEHQLVTYLQALVSAGKATPEFMNWWATEYFANPAAMDGTVPKLVVPNGIPAPKESDLVSLENEIKTLRFMNVELRKELNASAATLSVTNGKVLMLEAELEALRKTKTNATGVDPEYLRALEIVVHAKTGGRAM